jgi:dienelactone hydrolase
MATSFARPVREPCTQDMRNKRLEEIEYALDQIWELPWVDSDRIVLMGISERSSAVALWGKPGFQAHIILADNCRNQQPAAPDDTPVLAIVGGEDEFFNGSSCKVMRTTKGSGSIVIRMHSTMYRDCPKWRKRSEYFWTNVVSDYFRVNDMSL